MPAFQHKTVVKSYKLRIKNKLKSVVEETENVVTLLRSCVSSFTDRVDELLNSSDERFVKLYEKLSDEFEKYQEKLFFVHASLENPDVEEPINQVCEEDKNQQSVTVNTFEEVSRSQSASGQSHDNLVKPSQTSSLSSSSFCSLQDVCDADPAPSLQKKNSATNDRCDASVHSSKNLQNVEANLLQSSELQQDSSQSLSRNSFYSLSSNISAIKPQSVSSSITDSLNFDTHENDKQLVAQSVTYQSTSVSSRPASLILPSSISIPSVISATLTHVINPEDFWMQLENSKGHVLTFPLSLIADTDPPSCIQPGDYCLAPFKSNPVYSRARIITEISEDHTTEVFFIDHGSTHCVPIWDLRPLPEDLYKIPMQAVHCCLSDVLPLNGIWTQFSVDKLKEFQNNTLETHIKSFKSSETGYKYAVQLIATISAHFNEDFSCDIAQSLCIDGLATFEEVRFPMQESASEMSNQRSCDSGVSCSSNQRASPCTPMLYNSSDMLVNCNIPFEPSNALKKEAYLKSGHHIATDACTVNGTSDLMSFDSMEGMTYPPARNTDKNTLIGKCLRTIDCHCELHLEVPPPSIMFVEKDMMIVMLCHIVNPNEFYVNLAMPDSISLDDLRDQMTSTYESANLKSHSLYLGDLKEGMHLAARFEQDGHWYRVKVLRINAESERTCDAYVQYLDYGNKAFVKCGDLQPLLPQFAELPSFAIKCSLAGVTPKEETNSSGDGQTESQVWSSEAIEKFKSLVSFERCLTAQICELKTTRSAPGSIFASFKNKPLQVLLWDTEGTEDVLINEVFSESNQAEFENNIRKIIEENANLKAKETEILNDWDPMREEYEGTENSYGVRMDDPLVAISGYKPKDENYICKYFSLRGYCPRGNSCSFEHIPLAEGGVTRDQEEIYALDPIPALPRSCSYVMVQVSAVINPGLFYCILPFGDKTVDEVDALASRGQVNKVWMKNEVKALFKDMKDYYSNAPFTENTTVALSYGTIVVAWRRVDCSWHRARVLDVSDVTGPARVFFVDFGDEDWVPRKKIRQILPQFFHTPFQAVECHLSDVEPLGFEIGRKWSPEAVYHFQQMVAYQVLLAHVIYRSESILHLTLKKTNEEDHRSIGESLVREGFAQYVAFSASPKKECKYVPG